MQNNYERKTSGMTLLKHLAIRKTKVKNRNPNGIVDLKVSDVEAIVSEFKEMQAQRDEAMRLLGLRTLPDHKVLLAHGKTR